MSTKAELYEQDLYAWTQEQATVLRAQKWHDLDYENLAEEIESLGRGQKRELESRLEVLVMHLLKWRYQPAGRLAGHSWLSTIRTQRSNLRLLLRDNPSLRPQVAALVADSYPEARAQAAGETRLLLATFPEVCPWTPQQVLDGDFWPEGEPTP